MNSKIKVDLQLQPREHKLGPINDKEQVGVRQQIRDGDSEDAQNRDIDDDIKSNEDNGDDNGDEEQNHDDRDEGRDEDRGGGSDREGGSDEEEYQNEGEDDEEAQQYSDGDHDQIRYSNEEDEEEGHDEEEFYDHEQQEHGSENEKNQPKEEADDDENKEGSRVSEGNDGNEEDEGDDDGDDYEQQQKEKNEAFLRELENRKIEGKGQANLPAKIHRKSESGGSLDSFQHLEQIIMNEDNIFAPKKGSADNIVEQSKEGKQAKKAIEPQAQSAEAKKQDDRNFLAFDKPIMSAEKQSKRKETPKKSAIRESVEGIKEDEEIIEEQQVNKKNQEAQNLPKKREAKGDGHSAKAEKLEKSSRQKQDSIEQDDIKANRLSKSKLQETQASEYTKHTTKTEEVSEPTPQNKKKKQALNVAAEILKEELATHTKDKQTESKPVSKEKGHQKIIVERESSMKKIQEPEDDKETTTESNIKSKGLRNNKGMADQGFMEEPQPRVNTRKGKPVVQAKKEEVPNLAYKSKLAESQKKRETSPSPEGYEEGLELKHFKKSKLFQKFVKESGDSGKKPDPRDKADKSMQNKAPSKKDLGAPTRVFTDENDISGKRTKKNAKTNPKSKEKLSPPQGRFNDSLDEGELGGRDQSNANNRGEILIDNKYYNTLPNRPKDDPNTIDPHSQSMNLNFNSSSQYLPLYPQQSPNQFANYPGAMQIPYFGLGIPPGMDGAYLVQRNAAYDPRLSPEANEIFFLKGKLRDITKALEREEEANKLLEKRCNDYADQLEKVMYEIEELKHQYYEEKKGQREELNVMETQMKTLRDKLHTETQTEETLQRTLDELNKKIAAETNAKLRILEDKERFEKKLEQYNKKDRDHEESAEKVLEELMKLRTQAENDKQELVYLKRIHDQMLQKMKELENENERLKTKGPSSSKRLLDKAQDHTIFIKENDGLQSQISGMNSQYKDLAAENHKLKDELLEMKKEILELKQEEMNSKLSIEKYSRNINQLNSVLQRSEKSFGEQSRVIQDLNKEIMKLRERADQKGKAQQSPPRRVHGNITIEDVKKNRYKSPDLEEIPDEAPISHKSYPSRNKRDEKLPPHQAPLDAADEDNIDFKRKGSQSKSDYSDDSLKRAGESKNQDNLRPDAVNRLPGRGDRGSNSLAARESDSKKYASVRFQDGRQAEIEDKEQTSPVRGRRERSNRRQSPTRSRPDASEDMENDEPSKPLVPYDSREKPNRAYRANDTKKDSNENKADLSTDSIKQPRFKAEANKSDPRLLAWDADVKEVAYTSPGRKMFQGRNSSIITFGAGANTNITSPQNIRANAQNLNRTLSSEHEPHNAANLSSNNLNIGLKPLENQLMNFQIQRDKLNDEMKQLERNKIKSSANIARQKEIDNELSHLQNEISSIKYKIREINIHVLQKNY